MDRPEKCLCGVFEVIRVNETLPPAVQKIFVRKAAIFEDSLVQVSDFSHG
jgi:hypothetical protein